MNLKNNLAKKIFTIIGIIIGLGVLISLIYFFPYLIERLTSPGTKVMDKNIIEINKSSGVSTQDLEKILQDENFVSTFNSFYFPDSKVKEISQIGDSSNLFFILLEVADSFESVENFYKNKKVQSIWNRALIFETSKGNIEEEFLASEDKNVTASKFTYYSKDKDRVVNVLIKELGENKIEVMIIYWELV